MDVQLTHVCGCVGGVRGAEPPFCGESAYNSAISPPNLWFCDHKFNQLWDSLVL